MGHHSGLSHLLSSGRIGTLKTRNRIVMPAMGSNLGDGNGYVGERMKRYYESRAQGGAGLIIVELCSIDFPNGAAIPRQIGISNDEFLPGLRALTDSIHRHGAKAAVQLQHAGKSAVQDIAAGRPLLVPSTPSATVEGMDEMIRNRKINPRNYLASGK
jgi:2,4-dienoyl-CoA reductase-like NADH-dependent reductase (Old Yellow Enzyme family)